MYRPGSVDSPTSRRRSGRRRQRDPRIAGRRGGLTGSFTNRLSRSL
jgi:hypothetical protein